MSTKGKKVQTPASLQKVTVPAENEVDGGDDVKSIDLQNATFGRPALVRHAVAQGAMRVSRQTHDRVNNLAKHYLYCLIYTATRSAKSSNKRTINEQHILSAARRYGIIPAGFEFVKKKCTKNKGFANRSVAPTSTDAPSLETQSTLPV